MVKINQYKTLSIASFIHVLTFDFSFQASCENIFETFLNH